MTATDDDENNEAVRGALQRQRELTMSRALYVNMLEGMGVHVVDSQWSSETVPGTSDPRLSVTVWGDELSKTMAMLTRRATRAELDAEEARAELVEFKRAAVEREKNALRHLRAPEGW